jgi:Cof subfamily protein (haloacid dehalogenase superfamily)
MARKAPNDRDATDRQMYPSRDAHVRKPSPRSSKKKMSSTTAPPAAANPAAANPNACELSAPGISMSEYPIKLVAIDLDGTLLNSSKQVSAQTVQALRCLPHSNVKVVIASARPPRSVRHIYKALGLDTLQINYNGALIWDEVHGRTVFHRPMSGGMVREIITAARGLFPEILVSCEILDRWYTDRADQTYTTETGRMFKPDVICDVDEFCDGPITKLMLLGEPRLVRRLAPILSDQFGGMVTVLHADDDLLQIMDKRVGKAVALKKVAATYGIDSDEIMAIGDAPNDVGMLQLAGVAIAMDNAHPLVKKVADWIAPSNDDHGVHAALKRYGLCS